MKKNVIRIAASLICVAAVAVTAVGCSSKTADKVKKDVALDTVYAAVKDAYGADYFPDMSLTGEDIETRYGISADLYTEAVADIPMISMNVDELVLIKTVDEAAKDQVETALTEYQERLKADIHQYPVNQLMIQASQVYVKEDYVCFIMLGSLSNEEMQQEDSKVIEAYKAQNQKAIAAIDQLFE